MLYGLLVSDSASRALGEYFRLAILELGRAAGTHILLRSIGNPAESDPVYRSLRSPALCEQDALEAKAWAEIRAAGSESFHCSGQMMEAAERFELSPDDIPCIAFFTRTGMRPIGLLRISPSSYDSDASWRSVNHCFRAWLGREDVKRVATERLDEAEISEQLGPLLAALAAEMDGKIDSDRARIRLSNEAEIASASEPEKGRVRFNTPAGATWGDVKIRFVDGYTVSVDVLGMKGRYNYTQMGMADRRTTNPTRQWQLLEAFARRRGRLTWEDSEADPKNQKRRERLAGDLRAFFRIPGDPFCLDDDGKGWRARFTLLPGG